MKDIYSWVPWFGELTRTIADNGDEILAQQARRIAWSNDGDEPPLLRYGNHNIDPFSFIYSVAAAARHAGTRRRVYESVHEVFGLRTDLPPDRDEAFIFPTPPPVNLLFHYQGEGDPELLWRIFRNAVDGVESVVAEDFEAALRVKNIGTKSLTQVLFLTNPREFLPYDDSIRSLAIADASKSKGLTWDAYRRDVDLIRHVFTGCMPYEINLLAYEISKSDDPLKLDPQRGWQISTNVYDDATDRWDDFELNNWAYTGGPGKGGWGNYNHGVDQLQYKVHEPTPGDILLVRFAGQGHGIGTIYKNDYAEAMSDDSRLHVLWLCKREEQLASGPRAIAFGRGDGAIGDAFRTAYPETFRFLDRVVAQGSRTNDSTVSQAPEHAAPIAATSWLNTIFFGPPGTGKTYTTAKRCVEICDGHLPQDAEIRARYDELIEEGRVQFVTFHQSFGYEEFVEGIRPRTTVEGQIEYRIEDGILKRLAAKATTVDRLDKWGRFVPTGTSPPFDTLWNRLESSGGETVRTKSGKAYALVATPNNVELQPLGDTKFGRSFSKGSVRRLWDLRGEIGDPNEVQVNKVASAWGRSDNGTYLWVIYNQLWRRAGEEQSIMPEGSDTATMPNFVLVIDEINRANVSKVMGELITLLEEDKRKGAENEVTVTLPYSGERFTLPRNLHILGTMNTADRSIALLDTALRRRFRFEEMWPDPDLLKDAKEQTKVDLPGVVAAMNKRLEYLVDRDHLIGHAWFMNAKKPSDVDAVMRYKIIPLIAEYFYDDWSKVQAVLGGWDDFVKGERLGPPPGLESMVGEDRYRWTVQQTFPEDAYERLIAGRPSDGDE